MPQDTKPRISIKDVENAINAGELDKYDVQPNGMIVELDQEAQKLKAELRQVNPKSMDERDRRVSDLLLDAARAIENALNAIRDAGHTLIYQTCQGELQRYIDGLRRVRLTHYPTDENQPE